MDHHTILEGKPILLNLWYNLNNLIFQLVKMLHNQGHIMVLSRVNLVIRCNLAFFHHQANQLSQDNLFNRGSLRSQVNLFNQDNLHNQLTLLSSQSILCHS